jgi:hypothetical protein
MPNLFSNWPTNQAKELGIEIDLNYSFHKREE